MHLAKLNWCITSYLCNQLTTVTSKMLCLLLHVKNWLKMCVCIMAAIYLNQAHAGRRPRTPGFLELLLSVNVCMLLCVCVCVCVHPRGY